MAAIAWGGEAAIKKSPVTIVSVNPLSPRSYTKEAAGGLITFARHGQALLISSMVLAGISGPITIAGTAVMEMTESLAGLVLAQLVNPGVPCSLTYQNYTQFSKHCASKDSRISVLAIPRSL